MMFPSLYGEAMSALKDMVSAIQKLSKELEVVGFLNSLGQVVCVGIRRFDQRCQL